MEDPTSKGEESSKKALAAQSSSSRRRAKEVSVNAVNTAHQAPQQYSVNLTTAPTTAPTYFPPPSQHQLQSIYYSAPPVPPPTTSQSYDHFAPAPAQPSQPRPPVSRTPPPAQQNPTSQGQQAGGAPSRPRKQYSPLPAPLSHIYRQLLAGNQIQPISPGPNFDPSVQDQSKRCEYHQGAPGHTLDNCWRLRDEIQRRIDNNRLTFNAVRPPNVQANPLPDHRPSSGPSINMISICVSERDEEAQENPPPFVINYTPEEFTVGFTGHVASPAPFVVDVPAREPYSDSKVPWTYEGSIGSIEQQFSVMGLTRSGRVYENPTAKDKGKAPAVGDGATPESSPFPSKKRWNGTTSARRPLTPSRPT
ncbi:COPII coat assembly protein SEC16-like [Punica granatum]|uniref:COPII coat assembly protein SEC16-like n=1 Tax=Punica granatum TaxID=22663 RepID=A0A6P8CYI5_PUNGR|nr:COPII coat assembly protein SEC16-like [Punica granatum]